jgi:hypothetical protein
MRLILISQHLLRLFQTILFSFNQGLFHSTVVFNLLWYAVSIDLQAEAFLDDPDVLFLK